MIENEESWIFMKLALVIHMEVYVEENIKFIQLGHIDLVIKVKYGWVSDSNVLPMSFHPELPNVLCDLAV